MCAAPGRQVSTNYAYLTCAFLYFLASTFRFGFQGAATMPAEQPFGVPLAFSRIFPAFVTFFSLANP